MSDKTMKDFPLGTVALPVKQLDGLEKKLKKHDAKRKALLTRISRVKRSIGALERNAKR